MAQLLKQAEVGKGRRFFDIPVGTGRFFPLYKGLGRRALGVDVSPDMIFQAETKTKEVGLDVFLLRA